MNQSRSARMVHGDSQAMALLRNGEVDLMVTSPPYFPEDVEPQLFSARQSQDGMEQVRARILAYADSFRGHFDEIDRVLAAHGVLVLQLKDITYAGIIIRVVERHANHAEDIGLRMVSHVWWRCLFEHPKLRSVRNGKSFREPEQFLVFRRSGSESSDPHGDLNRVGSAFVQSPFWITPGEGSRMRMRHQSPQAVMTALIDMYSDPDDLIVDPFAGSGETLWTASKMGRRAIGYEIEQSLVDEFHEVLARRQP